MRFLGYSVVAMSLLGSCLGILVAARVMIGGSQCVMRVARWLLWCCLGILGGCYDIASWLLQCSGWLLWCY